MSEYVDPFGELTEGAKVMVSEENSEQRDDRSSHVKQPAPSASIIKTVDDVPAALERVTQMKIDHDWLARRAGKKK